MESSLTSSVNSDTYDVLSPEGQKFIGNSPHMIPSDENNGNSGDDEQVSVSSIEALNWSDFDEEELNEAQKDLESMANNLIVTTTEESISNNTNENNEEKKETFTASTTTDSKENDDEFQSNFISGGINTNNSAGAGAFNNHKRKAHGRIRKMHQRSSVSSKRDKLSDGLMNINTTMSYLSSDARSVESFGGFESNKEDLSRAPVLDEGPIWAKGENKSYRFHENQRINQKLTFGVLLSVVLAIGLGLGNLVAYNECEAEFKATLNLGSSVPFNDKESPSSFETPSTTDYMSSSSSFPTDKNKENLNFERGNIKNHPHPAKIPLSRPPIPLIKKEEAKYDAIVVKSEGQPERESFKPSYSTHHYHHHTNKPKDSSFETKYAEVLSKVVQSLEELSKKIDNFENTTKQLGGIILMKDENEEKGSSSNENKRDLPSKEYSNNNKRADKGKNFKLDNIKMDFDENDDDNNGQQFEKNNILNLLDDLLQIYENSDQAIFKNKKQEEFLKSSSGENYFSNSEEEEEVDNDLRPEYVKIRNKNLLDGEELDEESLGREIKQLMLYIKIKKALLKYQNSNNKQQNNIDDDNNIDKVPNEEEEKVLKKDKEEDQIIKAVPSGGEEEEVEEAIVSDEELEDDSLILATPKDTLFQQQQDDDDNSFNSFENSKEKEKYDDNLPNFENPYDQFSDFTAEFKDEDEDYREKKEEEEKLDKESKKKMKKEKKRDKKEKKNKKDKKYNENKYDSDFYNEHSGDNSSEKDWQSNRSKMREDNRKRKDDQEYNYRSGRKMKNWQFERDRIREKIRTKN